MRTINHYLTILSVILLGTNWGANAQCVTTFGYTAGTQIYTVPPGITQIQIDAQGAVGGASFNNSGGCGGRVYCNLAVTAGQVLLINVGGAGGTGFSGGPGGLGGYNDAGASGGNLGGGGGGGASDVRNGGTGSLADRVVVAGGGGGGGSVCALFETGGAGGNLIGGVFAACSGDGPGGGGTQAGGGAGGIYGGFASGSAGALGLGGAGATGTGGGGGGGGYYGGGGGSGGAGGGGSSFAYPGLTNEVVMDSGYNCSASGNGMVTIYTLPVAGPIVGHDTICVGGHVTYTDPASTGVGTWSSSNTAIGTIGSATGIAGGVSSGTVVLSYTVTSACGVSVSSETVVVGPGPITNLHPQICAAQTKDTVSDFISGGLWTSSSTSTATVGSLNGAISGVASGVVTIQYAIAGCYATTQVTVNPLPLPIEGDTFICESTTETLTDPTSGGTWLSGYPLIASVGSSSGFVTAIAHSGETPITYTLPTGCRALYSFPVYIHILPSPLLGDSSICHGFYDTLTMDASSYITGGVWSSSDTTIAKLTRDLGYPSGASFYGVGVGSVTISYTVPGCPPADTTLTVNPLPAPIDGITSICTGLAVSLSDSSAGGTWSSSDTSVATIDSVTGVVTTNPLDTIGESTTIIYTLPTGCLITQPVTVANAPPPITGQDSICQGTVITLSEDTTGGTWTSTSLATAPVVDTSGVVTGVASGPAVISYTLPTGCYAAFPIYVKPPIPAGVTIHSFPNYHDTICAGTPITFWATDTNAGTPTFQWQVWVGGGSHPLPDTRDTLVYTPIHGDYVIIDLTTHGICSVDTNVYDSAAINVWPVVTPSVTITVADTTNSMGLYILDFPGQVFTFNSSTVFGAGTPTYQWYVNGMPIPGATERSFSTAVYGNDTIFCEISGYPPCDATIHSFSSNAITIYGAYLGVNPVMQATNGLSLFPNPNNGGFTLSGKVANTAGNNLDIEVTDVLGNIIYSGKATAVNGTVSQQVLLDNSIPSGSYILRIKSDTDNEVFHFVISRR